MIDYFRGKTLICEQTKPRTYFTPVFQRIGDSLKLHHMEVDCLSYQPSKKMLPIEHMGKHKRRIFELEDENAKLREVAVEMYWDLVAEMPESLLTDRKQQLEELGIEVDNWNKVKRAENRGGPMLVEVSVPLDVIGMVKCDFDGNYHVEVNGYEVDTDEETYWRVIEARDNDRCYKGKVEVDRCAE